MISQQEALAIAQLIYFSPALLISIWLIFKHGYGRDQAWYFTTLISLCRVIGTACIIAAESTPNISRTNYINLLVAYYVCNSIGISFLIQALLCLVKKVNDGITSAKKFPTRILRLLTLSLLVAIILGAVSGGSLSNPQTTDSDKDKAKAEAGASAVLYTVASLVLLGLTVSLLSRLQAVQQQGDRTILYAVVASLPFLAIRLIYGLCVAFGGANPGDVFYRLAPNVWAQAFMSALPEFLIIGLILAAGLVAPPARKPSELDISKNSPTRQFDGTVHRGNFELRSKDGVNVV